MIKKTIERILYRLAPEILTKLYLPQFARIVAFPELPTETEKTSDEFYPRYAANIQMLDEHGNDAKISVFEAVPLPLSGVGNNAGRVEPPEVNSIVEVAFAYGRADKPFIRTVLPFGWDLPTIKEGETKVQTRDGVYQLVDEKGNFENKTDESLKDIIGKLAELECKTRKVTATSEQEHRSPKTWLGSDNENVLKLLSELMATVKGLADYCAQHKHSGVSSGSSVSGVPDIASDFVNSGNEANQQKERLDPITK